MANEAKIKQLEKEIADKQNLIEKLKQVSSAVIKLEDYTNEEKIKFFDKLYSSAMAHLKEAEEKGYTDEDTPHYMYEEVFGILNLRSTRELWKYFNSLQ